MTDIEHDDYCPDKGDRRCDCEWEASVRADERAALNGKLLRLYTQITHAEAVAARLVEVICRMDEQAEWYTPGSLERARHQRDAARAEVAALREQVQAISDEAADLRTEVDILREQVRTGAW